MADLRVAFVLGTLDLMVLTVLLPEPMHGWGISELLLRHSGDVFQVNQGSLYLGLDRLQRRGWISSSWRLTENNRRARYYALTRAGRKELTRAAAQWAIASSAVNLVLATAGL